ncbi:MAG: hypothetical protein QOC96_2913 [Acidobacteriota bacterium]|jgi:hypothetical protein|nr:hypothetical protein [Acidobacteriota bacterium]
MRKKFLLGTILAVALTTVGAVSYALATSKPAQKTHQYRCTDRNQSLYFLVYEVDGKLDRGLMYVENMQVANMTVEQAGTDVIKAKVNGDAADVAFQLFKSGKILVANYQTNTRTEVCKASYAYK